jgi:hypothetical protein
MSEILLEEMSPLGTAAVKVEDDGRAVYFHLCFTEVDDESCSQFKACWVRNRLPAPREIDMKAMEQGLPPLMPAQYCKHKGAGPPLAGDNLRVIWFEEVDAAALLEGNQILAVIPGWSGHGDFHGYARDCVGEGPFAWELQADNAMHDRVRLADEFWQLWDDDEFWPRWRDERIAAVESRLGKLTKYYAIDKGEFPPKAILRFDLPDRCVLVTMGVSLFCLPKVERYFDDPSPYRRIELAAAVSLDCPENEVLRLGQYLSGQAKYPWSHMMPLGSGHTMPCDSTPASCGGKQLPAVLLAHELPGIQPLEIPGFRGDRTNVLWFYPISQAERELAMKQGTDRLLELLSLAGYDGVVRKRPAVVG